MITLNEHEFLNLLKVADDHCDKYNALQKGQCLYWALNKLYPKIAKHISKSIYDPFNMRTEKLPVFYKKIYPNYDFKK